MELELCYRKDGGDAYPSILLTFSQLLPPPSPLLATTAWSLTLSNGWCLYSKLYNVSDMYPLNFMTSTNNGTSWTPGGSLTVPAATLCASTLSPPIISPLGFSSVGPVIVTVGTSASDAATYYRLTGAGYSPLQLYTSPFILNQPGNTTVLAYSARAGTLSSMTVVSTYIIRHCSSVNVTSVGVAPIPSSEFKVNAVINHDTYPNVQVLSSICCVLRLGYRHWRQPSHRHFGRVAGC